MSPPSQKFFLGRQPILDRDQEIVGYELLFRAAEKNVAEIESYSRACASVIEGALSTFGIQDILGNKFGFINVHEGILLSEMLELLPTEQSVLELLEFIELDDQVIERCRELKGIGFRIALDDHQYDPVHSAFYDLVDIIKIDLLQTDPEKLPEIVRELRKYPLKILAEKVETIEQFEACHKMGFDLFQGYFFERPVVLKRKRFDVSGLSMLKLLQQLINDAPLNIIEQTFKENPALSYNLLRLVNSVGIGLREKIKTLRHAILMLGTGHLRRWIQLSLFAGNDTRGVNSPLLEMAAVRGRLMEVIVNMKSGAKGGGEFAEEAFMTGILSLLDVLFENAMEEVISNLNLSEDVAQALLHRTGRLGELLALAECLEKADFDAAVPLMESCGVSLDDLLSAQLEAFNWKSSVVVE